MSKVKVKLNRKEVSNQLLKGGWIDSVMKDIADGIAQKCGGVYEVETYSGKRRDNVAIITSDKNTYYKNLKDNELLKAMGGQ